LKIGNRFPVLKSMIARRLTPLLEQRLKQFPAVALVGPRRCAKTTLAQSIDRLDFNLENPAERTRLDATWATRRVGRVWWSSIRPNTGRNCSAGCGRPSMPGVNSSAGSP
jgi:hypothetical protein